MIVTTKKRHTIIIIIYVSFRYIYMNFTLLYNNFVYVFVYVLFRK